MLVISWPAPKGYLLCSIREGNADTVGITRAIELYLICVYFFQCNSFSHFLAAHQSFFPDCIFAARLWMPVGQSCRIVGSCVLNSHWILGAAGAAALKM